MSCTMGLRKSSRNSGLLPFLFLRFSTYLLSYFCQHLVEPRGSWISLPMLIAPQQQTILSVISTKMKVMNNNNPFNNSLGGNKSLLKNA